MQSTYDVAVIGGGIHGAGAAQAIAAAGHSVCLLEQNDIATGTSSKSSKLIHGGLRYLESGQFSLVKECLRERQYLLNNAPHLVELVPFIIPIYQQTKRRPLTIRLGLSLYALLNGFRKSGLFKSISKNDWHHLDGISTHELQAVFQYWDAKTDDKRLTRAVVESMCQLGGEVIKPARVTQLERQDSLWSLSYEMQGTQNVLQASVVVNASGPWVNQVLSKVTSKPKTRPVDLVQGSHIVLAGQTDRGVYYLESAIDQRAIFVIPWYGNTMVGTTEKVYQGDPDAVKASDAEVDYLLESVKPYFPKFKNVGADQILDKFAGLRVLPRANSAAFSRPRETYIFEDQEKAAGLFSIYGGKLTAYRATSEMVMKKIAPSLPTKTQKADTRFLTLPDVS